MEHPCHKGVFFRRNQNPPILNSIYVMDDMNYFYVHFCFSQSIFGPFGVDLIRA